MPDYDTKNIPVLDDVIKDEITENTASEKDEESSVAVEAAQNQAENNLELFPDESDRLVSEENDPQIGIIDGINEDILINIETTQFSEQTSEISSTFTAETLIADTEITEIESNAQQTGIDEAEDNSGDQSAFAMSALTIDHTDETYDEARIDTQVIESNLQTAVEPLSLEATVEDIVKRLMPELEHHLRFLIQQALEEKLSHETIEPISTDNINEQTE
jgi:hypothetical protein